MATLNALLVKHTYICHYHTKNIHNVKYLDKRSYCVGTEPSELVYIGILVTSTINGHGGSVVSALSSQAKGRGSFPSCDIIFFLPFPSVRPNGQSINLVGFCQ